MPPSFFSSDTLDLPGDRQDYGELLMSTVGHLRTHGDHDRDTA
jgi:hypothetical protein